MRIGKRDAYGNITLTREEGVWLEMVLDNMERIEYRGFADEYRIDPENPEYWRHNAEVAFRSMMDHIKRYVRVCKSPVIDRRGRKEIRGLLYVLKVPLSEIPVPTTVDTHEHDIRDYDSDGDVVATVGILQNTGLRLPDYFCRDRFE